MMKNIFPYLKPKINNSNSKSVIVLIVHEGCSEELSTNPKVILVLLIG